MTISELPYDVVVQVTADPDKVETDRLMGQNLSQFIISGAIFNPQLLPFMDFLLSGFGLDPSKAEMIQQRLQAYQQGMMEEQQAMAEMQEIAGVDPGQMPQEPVEGAAFGGPPQQMEGAMQ